jgi:peroxiredoxin
LVALSEKLFTQYKVKEYLPQPKVTCKTCPDEALGFLSTLAQNRVQHNSFVFISEKMIWKNVEFFLNGAAQLKLCSSQNFKVMVLYRTPKDRREGLARLYLPRLK